MSLHGITKNAWNRYTAEGSWYYEIVAPGFKYNLTDIASAIGLAQLRRLDAMSDREDAQIAARYNDGLRGPAARLEIPSSATVGRVMHGISIPLRLRSGRPDASIGRGFVEELTARNIGTSVHFIPLHLHPYYRDTYGYKPARFPDRLWGVPKRGVAAHLQRHD